MLIDPVLCGLLEPWAQLNPCNISYPSTEGGPYVLGRVEQHIVYLPWLWGISRRLARIAAGLLGCVVWRSLPELYC